MPKIFPNGINIPTAAEVTKIMDAYGERYQATLPDGTPNPLTKAQFARRELLRQIGAYVRSYEERQRTPISQIDITEA